MLRLRTIAALMGAALLVSVAGCGQNGPGPLTPVRGAVTYRRIPLQGGIIVFSPDTARGGAGSLARGDIQPNGTYVLRTGDLTGAAPGWHRVTVLCVQSPSLSIGPGTYGVPRSLIPEKYRDPELSGLACEVKLGFENTINFNLE
jgi:hypothetical protein